MRLKLCRVRKSSSGFEKILDDSLSDAVKVKESYPLMPRCSCFMLFTLLFFVVCGFVVIFLFSTNLDRIFSSQRTKIGVTSQLAPKEFEQQSELSIDPSCPLDLEDELKFDCFPADESDEEKCLKRGCCWSISPKQNVPFCYYPTNYALYVFTNVTHLIGNPYPGMVGYLKQIKPSGYPEDIPLLKLVATFETRSRLRVKITDALNKRYEVDVLESLDKTDDQLPTEDFNYAFEINTDIPGFSIFRKFDREVIFSSVGIGGFVYANQFLQISSLLPSGNIYGLGENQDSLRHSTDWQRFALFAHDVIPEKGRNLYGAHPFYLVMENTGLSHGVFLKNSDPIEVILQPAPAITFRALGGILDFYFFLGPSPQEVIEQYTQVIGYPAMPPYWGLGFHLCRYNYGSVNRTREVWERTRAAGIPFDVQWNDIDYMDTAKDFTYDQEKFAGLPAFVDDIHASGMRWVPIIDPGVSNAELQSGYPPYDQGVQMNIFVKNSTEKNAAIFVGKVWNTVSTVWPDFTHPNVTEYWTQQLQFFHDQVKFDGTWIDMNEPSNFYDGTIDGCPVSQWDNPPYTPAVEGGKLCYKTLCMSAGQYGGIHYDLHNLYGLMETIATNFALKQIRGKRPFIISRSSYPGQGHYGGHWSGDVVSDWPNLGRSITSILNYNMFGIPLVGADICGFNGNTTASLCQRWMELGAFYPFSRNHNTDDAIDQDPVALGEEVVKTSKKALMVRYTLLPYLYTLFWHASSHGATVARPLFFEFPFDRQTYSIDTQFMWGSGLMIAPVLTEDTVQVNSYMPRGLWYDFYSFKKIASQGRWVFLAAPLDTIPLLLRGGSIIPTQAPDVTTTKTRQKPFDLLVMFNETKQAYGDLYWDDGDTIDAYNQSLFNYYIFEASIGKFSSACVHSSSKAPNAILSDVSVIGIDFPVSSVTVNGKAFTNFTYKLDKNMLLVTGLKLSLNNAIVITFV